MRGAVRWEAAAAHVERGAERREHNSATEVAVGLRGGAWWWGGWGQRISMEIQPAVAAEVASAAALVTAGGESESARVVVRRGAAGYAAGYGVA
jgi:hypothetical protein